MPSQSPLLRKSNLLWTTESSLIIRARQWLHFQDDSLTFPIARTCLSTLFWSGIGITFGGPVGLRVGSVGAPKLISDHPESMKRIESVCRKVLTQGLKQEPNEMNKGKDIIDESFSFSKPKWVLLETSGLGSWWIFLVQKLWSRGLAFEDEKLLFEIEIRRRVEDDRLD